MVSCQLAPDVITTVEETATEGPRFTDNHRDQEGGGHGQRIVDRGRKSFVLKYIISKSNKCIINSFNE